MIQDLQLAPFQYGRPGWPALVLGVCAALLAPVPWSLAQEAGESAATTDSLTPIELGRRLFTQETFGGNGRVCSTCHALDRFGTITPEHVRQLFDADPEAPLFRAIDSDDGRGVAYERLKNEATFRVPIKLAADKAKGGLAIRKCDAPAEASVVLNRGSPSVFNVALENFLMADGREGSNLEHQALNAIEAHVEPGREPTPEELAAIAAFEESLFSHAAIRTFLDAGRGLRLPDGSTPSEIRGRAFFAPDRQCGICHSGPMLNRTSEFWPAVAGEPPDMAGGRFESVLVGAEPDNPNEKFDWCFVDPGTNRIVPGPAGNSRVFPAPVSDPGILLTPGTPLDVPLPLFKIPTLWGTPNTAPYFHDNSAKTLDDVLDQYNFMFGAIRNFAAGAGCDPDAPECLSEQNKADIKAFMQLLAFER